MDGKLQSEVIAAGGLYGTDEQAESEMTIDSWFREVHYLVKDGENWRFFWQCRRRAKLHR